MWAVLTPAQPQQSHSLLFASAACDRKTNCIHVHSTTALVQ
jgi:hypothetical protein